MKVCAPVSGNAPYWAVSWKWESCWRSFSTPERASGLIASPASESGLQSWVATDPGEPMRVFDPKFYL